MSDFRAARDFLLESDATTARRDFRWPALETFNWALDWFDGVLAAETPGAVALKIVGESSATYTFAELSARSGQVANWLHEQGVRRGDRVLLMLGNQAELWESLLAVMKLGAVVIPATTLLTGKDIAERIERGGVSHVIANAADAGKFPAGAYTKIAVGDAYNWLPYHDAYHAHERFTPDGPTRAGDTLLLYFTSGTTSQPKLVEHTHASYPAGHLSTMFWIGVRPGDVHLNVSSPGWAKHAWSNVFAPWNAGATVLVHDYRRFSAPALLEVLRDERVTTFCAPPTVWRMLIQEDLAAWRLPLRTAVAAGEPLNPEIIDQVAKAWGITIRDGYGQTETTAQIGNAPGEAVKPGSMGLPLPGYDIVLIDPVTGEQGNDGEICLPLDDRRPLGLMSGYVGGSAEAMRDGFYRTGDVATRDDDGYITYVGRTDDVFKASDYRISPFELESVLLEHEAVTEAAVVPAPDPVRLAVPKAYVTLAPGFEPGEETARSIFEHCRRELAPYKRVRRLEFDELPKTISGKIRRVELRVREPRREYREEDLNP
ncbi:AMP-binding protein [Nonomuraea gerenzanensis]|uniref:Acetyl-coenzyme A synthetase n=1 Tax=Nonomuraea gerenzanensis TaxID=93944 RepID=A0A1M4E2Y0_9ACTN|nr:AMP-binding protein [Nonomuraea gerenzanensis]UBU15408.1 AMP-binding protein [Nonomuraea gerenzanensis]SBO93164.1 Acetyl-coenzyme A synthetase [Nonomuraea gerenzanensis]